MSRIGKLKIKILPNVRVDIKGNRIKVEGSYGQLSSTIPDLLNLSRLEEKDKEFIVVERINESRQAKQLHGLYRSLVNDMIKGVFKPFSKFLELKGVGYKATMEKDKLILNVGFTHPVKIIPPEGIQIFVENNTIIKVEGINKEHVGLLAQKIHAIRPPEPYKGKGILYKGEIVQRKVGKSSK